MKQLTTKDIKLMIIENFIDHWEHDDAAREIMKSNARTYVDEDHVDEIQSIFPSEDENENSSNYLINTFMGLVFYDDENSWYEPIEGLHLGHPDYVNDWNILITACKKWDTLYIEHPWLNDSKAYRHMRDRLGEAASSYNIEELYYHLVKNIEWFNEQLNEHIADV